MTAGRGPPRCAENLCCAAMFPGVSPGSDGFRTSQSAESKSQKQAEYRGRLRIRQPTTACHTGDSFPSGDIPSRRRGCSSDYCESLAPKPQNVITGGRKRDPRARHSTACSSLSKECRQEGSDTAQHLLVRTVWAASAALRSISFRSGAARGCVRSQRGIGLVVNSARIVNQTSDFRLRSTPRSIFAMSCLRATHRREEVAR